MHKTIIFRLKKLDLFFFAYILLTSLLIITTWNTAVNPVDLMINRIAIILVIFVLLTIENKSESKIIQLIRNTYPLILSGYFYKETAFYNKFLFSDLDPLLEKMDYALFGFQPSLLFSERYSNLFFSELMYFGYFSFFILIITLVLVFYFFKKDKFTETVFYFTSSIYLFYLIFAFFPSAGPQFYYPSPENELPKAYLFDKVMHIIQIVGEEPTGAFPSSHVGVSIIFLILIRKVSVLVYQISVPIVFLLILATVYIKAHFVVDIIGGILFAPVVLYLSKQIYRVILEKSFKGFFRRGMKFQNKLTK